MVQRGTLAYPGPDGLAREEVLAKPLVLPHGAAGGTLAVLQLRWSELGLHPMKLARVVRVMVLCLSVDMASSNIKLLGFLTRALPKNILILPLYCMLHQIHRVVAGFDKHTPVAREAYSLSRPSRGLQAYACKGPKFVAELVFLRAVDDTQTSS